MVELADTTVSKTVGSNTMGVRLPPLAPSFANVYVSLTKQASDGRPAEVYFSESHKINEGGQAIL